MTLLQTWYNLSDYGIEEQVNDTLSFPEGQESGQRSVQPGVDQEASWVKKSHKLQYGYKRHYLADAQEGMVLSVHTTGANAHDSQYLEVCLSKVSLPARSCLLADKGYSSQANEALLRSRGVRQRYIAQGLQE